MNNLESMSSRENPGMVFEGLEPVWDNIVSVCERREFNQGIIGTKDIVREAYSVMKTLVEGRTPKEAHERLRERGFCGLIKGRIDDLASVYSSKGDEYAKAVQESWTVKEDYVAEVNARRAVIATNPERFIEA